MDVKQKRALDLTPAKWIWVPSARTLPNTFAKFKRTIQIDGEVVSAKGYSLGVSRYLMKLNDQRVQWGPAPSDPRYEEADTLDITGFLKKGENVLDILVCYFLTIYLIYSLPLFTMYTPAGKLSIFEIRLPSNVYTSLINSSSVPLFSTFVGTCWL